MPTPHKVAIPLSELQVIRDAVRTGRYEEAAASLNTIIDDKTAELYDAVYAGAQEICTGEDYIDICAPGTPDFEVSVAEDAIWISAWVRVPLDELPVL